jgi:hypothetical protein
MSGGIGIKVETFAGIATAGRGVFLCRAAVLHDMESQS